MKKVNTSKRYSPLLDKNTIAISFANSQKMFYIFEQSRAGELFSILFLRQITLWFENPKFLQSLQNAQRDTMNFAVNKETLVSPCKFWHVYDRWAG